MVKRGLLKKTKYFLGWILFKISSLIIGHFSLKTVYKISDGVGLIVYYLVKRFRRTSFESLNIAFGDSFSKKEKRNLVKATFKNFTKSILENLFFIENPYFIDKYVKIRGLENLKQALGRKRGVIVLTAHFGNFPLLCARLALLGVKVNVLARPMRELRMDREVAKIRKKFKIGVIYSYPKREAVKKSLEVLRRNELIIVLMDQNFGTGGIEINFFGKKAATPRGPVVFALRTGSPIVPMFIIRKENSFFQEIIIEKPYSLKRDRNLQNTIFEYVQNFTDLTEGYIRKYPNHWAWMHRRWKSRATKRR